MKINESFVLYLFSKFHEKLGFEKIILLQAAFPDCYAIKDGKKVSVEFEARSYSLRDHLLENRLSVQYYKDHTNEIEHSYPKSNFRIEIENWGIGKCVNIYRRKLDLDYCVCWEHKLFSTVDPAWFSGVKILELREVPFIREFMKDRGYLSE